MLQEVFYFAGVMGMMKLGGSIFVGVRVPSKGKSQYSMDLKMGLVLVSNKILLKGETVCWMYRALPEEKGDSGWRVFSGTEDESYLTDHNNFKFILADSLMAIDDSLKANLLAPCHSSFERNQATKEWEMVDEGEFF